MKGGRISNLMAANKDLSSSAPLKEGGDSPSPSMPLNERHSFDGNGRNDSSVSTRRYSNRKSETNLSAQNPLNKHRKSIKNKIIIDEQQIYKQRKSQSNMKKKEKYNSAPRTSQQFNPKTIKKRQS